MNTDLAETTEIRATCSREDLAAALGVVARGLSTRGAVQVLSGILLRGEEGKLSLSSTDMEISLRATIAGDVAGDGGVVVPGRLLTDLCRLLPDDTVTLAYEEGEGVLGVTSGSHASRLNVYSAEDFPRLPPTDIPLHTIAAPALLATIEKVARAASRDESRPVLTGILVRFEGDRLTMAATDSYRLAVKETELEESGPELDAIIPARALQELARLAGGADEVQARRPREPRGLQAARRLADEPQDRRAVPELQAAASGDLRGGDHDLSRAAPRGHPPRQRARAAKRTLAAALRGGRADGVRADPGHRRGARVDPIDYAGEPLEIGFNPDFLRDGLEAVAGETVQIKLINPLRPAVISRRTRASGT